MAASSEDLRSPVSGGRLGWGKPAPMPLAAAYSAAFERITVQDQGRLLDSHKEALRSRNSVKMLRV